MADRPLTTLVDLFHNGASINPNKVAVIYDNGQVKLTLKYADLQSQAAQITEELKILSQESVVGVVMQPGCYVPVALVGILSVPAAYYPIDASNTKAVNFLADIIDRLQLKVFIVDHVSRSFVDILQKVGFADITVRRLEALSLMIISVVRSSSLMSSGGRKQAEFAESVSSKVAYVITTSGTTGVPKIVRVPHQCIVPNIVHISEIYKLSAEDIVFQASPLTFDPSVVEIFTTLSVGATLLTVPDTARMRPRDLAHCLTERNRVTVIQATPTLVSSFGASLLRHTLLAKYSSLRVLSLGGEQCPDGSTLQLWREDGNKTLFINIYGVTEVSCWAMWYQLTDNDLRSGRGDIPLGSALAGTTVETRNTDPATGIAELWIGGKERVCWINDEDTASAENMRFSGDLVVRNSDGSICYRGRKDDMVKRHGKRFHLQEVEKVARRIDDVAQVVAVEDDNKLLLFVVIRSETNFMLLSETPMLHSSRRHTSSIFATDERDLPGGDDVTAQSNAHHQRALSTVVSALDNQERLQREPTIAVMHTGRAVTLQDVSSTEQTNRKQRERKIVSNILGQIEQWLPAHCCPDDVVLVDDMPFTKHGKVDKKRLLQWYNARLQVIQSSNTGPLVDNIRQLVCRLWQTYLSTDDITDWMDRLFVECGGNSLSAVRLAEDISFALKVDANVTSELVDTVLHGNFQDVVSYLGRVLRAHQREDIVRGDDLGTESDVSLLKRDAMMSPTEDSSNYTATDSSVTELDIVAVKSIRRLSSVDVSQSHKRRRHTSSNLNTDESTAHLDDADCSTDAKSAATVDVAESASGRCLCNCFDDSLIAEDREFFSVTRGSCRIACCHVTGAESVELRIESKYCCLINRLKTADELDSHACCRDKKSVCLKVEWKYDTGKCIDASPLIVCNRTGQGFVYIGSHSHRFTAVCLDSGVASWEVLLGDRIESSAAISLCEKFLIVGCYDGKVYVINRRSGDVHWFYQTDSQVKSSPLVNTKTGAVYVGSHDKCLYAFDIQDCRCLWKANLNSGSLFSSPCMSLCPYQVIIGTLGGQLIAVHPDSGCILWVCAIGMPMFSSPVPYKNGYIVGCVDNCIYAVDHCGQRTVGPVFSTAYVLTPRITVSLDSHLPRRRDEEVILIGSHDSYIYCLSYQDGKLVWKAALDSAVYSTPFVWQSPCYSPANDGSKCVVACSQKGVIYLLGLSTGQILIKLAFSHELFSSPVAYNDRIIVGCRDNNVYSIVCETLQREPPVEAV